MPLDSSLPEPAEQPLEVLISQCQESGISIPEIPDSELLAQILRVSLRAGDEIAQDAKQQASEINTEIAQKIAETGGIQEYFHFACMPTDLCRTSPFFPLAKKDLSKREPIDNLIVAEGSWGRIRYTGKKLSMREESVLLATLALMDRGKSVRVEDSDEGLPTYKYRGPRLPLIRLAGLEKGGSANKSVMDAFELLTSGTVVMETYHKDSRKKRKIVTTTITNMVSLARWNSETEELSVTINPYFYEIYIKKNYTLIDVTKRAQLKSPVAQAVYRFISSHTEDRWPVGGAAHYSTLAKAINLNEKLSEKDQIDQLRRAIKALMKEGILLKGSLIKRSHVVLIRNPKLNRRIIKK